MTVIKTLAEILADMSEPVSADCSGGHPKNQKEKAPAKSNKTTNPPKSSRQTTNPKGDVKAL